MYTLRKQNRTERHELSIDLEAWSSGKVFILAIAIHAFKTLLTFS